MALDFDIRDPKNQQILAAVMIMVLAMYGFYRFMIQPKAADIAGKKTEIVTLRGQLASMRGSPQEKTILLAEKERLDLKLKEVESYLPDHENVAELLDQFSMVENETRVYVVGFKANETAEETGQPYRANKYKITVEAGYHQFVEFMSAIMALPRIISFSDMKISPNPNAPNTAEVNEGLEDQPRSLSIECSVTSYVFRDVSPAKVEEKKK